MNKNHILKILETRVENLKEKDALSDILEKMSLTDLCDLHKALDYIISEF